MKLAVGERNVATNLGIISGCVIEYCFSIWITNLMNVYKNLFIHQRISQHIAHAKSMKLSHNNVRIVS